jgi:hypothetical protein
MAGVQQPGHVVPLFCAPAGGQVSPPPRLARRSDSQRIDAMTTTDSRAEGVQALGSPPLTERLCSVIASAVAQDPIGSGGTLTRLLAMEMPTPWGEDFYTADPQGTLQQRMRAVHLGYFQRLRDAGIALPATGYPGFYGIAPDQEWSTPDRRRVFLATRPEGPCSRFDMAEYFFPFESPALLDLVTAFFEQPEHLAAFDRFKTGNPVRREFFVCTHGQVDICCAKFGVPLYQQARAAYPTVRAWRMTHFGGHRYAPTAWEFPSGYKWAFLDPEATRQVIVRDGATAALARRLRGWSGVPLPVQLLDREGLTRHGWHWLAFKRHGEIVDADPEAKRWRVRLTFEAPSRSGGVYEGTVVVARELADRGCGRHWGEHDHQVPEYRLEDFRAS